jgi:hypothetical protein
MVDHFPKLLLSLARLSAVRETIRMVGAMRHNSRLVIVIFSCGSARAKAGGERHYYQTGGCGLAKRHGLIPFGGVALVGRTFLRLRRFLAQQVKFQQ